MNKTEHWQKVYLNKAADSVSWFQSNPSCSLELIDKCRLNNNDAILDVGAGASLLVDHLIAQGYSDVTLLDIAAAALNQTRQRLVQHASVKWIEADITEWNSEQRFQLWHDRAVFHFLTSQTDRDAYCRVLNKALNPGAFVIIATFAKGGPEKCSGLPIVQYDQASISSALGSDFSLLDSLTESHVTPWGSIQAFNYFRLIKR